MRSGSVGDFGPLSAEPWQRLEREAGWDELVLPASAMAMVRALPARLSERFWSDPHDRAGLLAVFRGPSGSGKTLAVNAAGTELGLPVFRADLGHIANGGIATSSRGLAHLFATAQHSGAVVELDGAEVLGTDDMQSSSDPTGLDVADLLRRVESYPGLVVVSCHGSRGPIERITAVADTVVDFPVPDAVSRVAFWRQYLPEGAQVADGEIALLADGFPVSAGAIAAACAAAAEQAEGEGVPVVLAHLTAALKREVSASRPAQAAARVPEPEAVPPRMRVPEPEAVPPRTRFPEPTPSPSRVPEPEAAPPRTPFPEPTPSPPRVPEPDFSPLRVREPAFSPPRVPGPPSRTPEAARSWAWPARTPAAPVPSRRTAEPVSSRPRLDAGTPRRAFPAWLVATAVVGGIAAVGLGLGLAHGNHPKAPPLILSREVSSGPLKFSYPSSWSVQATPSLPGLTLSNAVAVGAATRPKGQLVVGTTAGTSAGLPPTFTSTLAGNPEPNLVSLGSRHFYRLLDSGLTSGGRGEAVYLLSSNGRTVVAVCRAEVEAFAALCERVLGTLAVTPAPSPAPVLSSVYATGLNTILTALGAERARELTALAKAASRSAQARAAKALADSHRKAAGAVGALPAGNAARTANAALSAALARMANGYADLERAAASGNSRAYATAESEIAHANGAVGAAVATLKRLGYQLA